MSLVPHPFRLVVLGLGLAVCLAPPPLRAQASTPPGEEGGAPEGIQVPKPPFSEGIFPCSMCHDGKSMKPNPRRRELTAMHTDIVLKHGPASRWCLDCHDLNDRDRLHLVSGEKIDFTVSYRLCGQCHGDKYRDWKVGVHGKRTGQWNGPKQYLLCVNCHNPHTPHFKPLKPLPPPVPPTAIKPHQGGAR